MTFLAPETVRAHGLETSISTAQAEEEAIERERDHRRLVASAVADGRVSANRQSFWLDHLRKAPQDVELLAAMAAPIGLPAGAWPER